MDATMLGKAVKKLGAIPDTASGVAYDFLEKLSGKEWRVWHEVFKLLSRVSPEKAIEILSRVKPIFTDLNIQVDVPKGGKFVAKKMFVGAKKFFYTWHGTKLEEIIDNWVEDEVPTVTLISSELSEDATDEKILEFYGDKEAVEITFGQLYYVLGDDRFKDDEAYYGYLKGIDFMFRFRWCSGNSLILEGTPIRNHTWHAGCRLIRRIPPEG